MYDVRLSPQATKFFRKLPANIQERIREKFKDVSQDPFRYIEHYEGDHHKIRIGDYRALVDIDQAHTILWVRVFDKRGRIYK